MAEAKRVTEPARAMELAKAEVPMTEGGLRPLNMDGLQRMAAMIAVTSFAPKGMTDPAAIAVAIDYGATVGLAPLQALQSIGVINGKPCLYGDAPLGLVRVSGLAEWIKEEISGAGDNRTATFSAKRKDDPNPIVRTFSVADAKRAKLWGKQGPWTDYPDRMLMFRARGFGLRDAFPEVLKGLITEHEARDMPELPSGDSDTREVEARVIAESSAPLPEVVTKPPERTEEPPKAEPDPEPVDDGGEPPDNFLEEIARHMPKASR